MELTSTPLAGLHSFACMGLNPAQAGFRVLVVANLFARTWHCDPVCTNRPVTVGAGLPPLQRCARPVPNENRHPFIQDETRPSNLQEAFIV
jgi:hypothetical protein